MWDSNPRDPLRGPAVFKTAAFDRTRPTLHVPDAAVEGSAGQRVLAAHGLAAGFSPVASLRPLNGRLVALVRRRRVEQRFTPDVRLEFLGHGH